MMLTVQIPDDGREAGAQAVHLIDLQAQTRRLGSVSRRRSSLPPHDPVGVLESLHAGFLSRGR